MSDKIQQHKLLSETLVRVTNERNAYRAAIEAHADAMLASTEEPQPYDLALWENVKDDEP